MNLLIYNMEPILCGKWC